MHHPLYNSYNGINIPLIIMNKHIHPLICNIIFAVKISDEYCALHIFIRGEIGIRKWYFDCLLYDIFDQEHFYCDNDDCCDDADISD